MEKKYLIRDFLKRFKRPIQLLPDKEYKLITISSKHKGIKLRELKKGSLVKSSMFEVKAGDFVLSGIDARNGAFGIIPKELDGGIITNDFWCLEINENVISKELFLELTATTWFDELCNRGSDGTTNRVRLQKDKFFNQEVALPLKGAQEHLLEIILTIKKKSNILKQEIENQKQLLSKFKKAILQEAIQGKLTEHWRSENPDVEPASKFLKCIKAEKAKLIKEKKIKKEKELAPISKEEIPFEIPENWTWSRLGVITNYGSSEKIEPNHISNYTWVLDLEDIEKESSKILQRITFEQRPSTSTKSVFRKGWVLYSKLRPYLDKVVVVDEDGVCTTEILPLPVFGGMNPKYLMYTMKGKHFLTYVNSKVGGMKMPRLKTPDGQMALIPLAPLSEQLIIVEKVETLMAKCTALEKQIIKSEQYANMLMHAVLKEVFESKETKVKATQMDRSLQLALMQMMFKQNLGINYGEVIMQKTAYNLDHLYNRECSFFPYSFQSSNHGSFSLQLREEIESNSYLTTKSTEKGKVICVDPKQNSSVLDAFSNPVYKDYIQSLTQLLEIYTLPIIGKKSDQIELFNTVLKIMNDLNVKDINTIYSSMEDWEIEQKGFKTKAEKFPRIDTHKILNFILRIKSDG